MYFIQSVSVACCLRDHTSLFLTSYHYQGSLLPSTNVVVKNGPCTQVDLRLHF